MKISQAFYQNQLNNIIKGGVLFSLIFFSSIAYSQGFYNKFEQLLDNQKTKYNSLINDLINKDFDIKDIKSINEVRLDLNYLNILIQNTPTRYMLLANNDKCSIYDLLNANLLKAPGGELQQVIFTYEDKSGLRQKRLLPKSNFLKLIAAKQCPKTLRFKQYFNLKNVRKTLSKITLKSPTSEEACLENILNFKKDLKSPYLCSIVELLRNSKMIQMKYNNLSKVDYKNRAKYKKILNQSTSYKKIISKTGIQILEDQCLNLNNPKRYCSNYFKQSFWTKTATESPKSIILSTYCKGMSKKKCIRELNKNPYYCHYSALDKPGIFPKPSCKNISKALLQSRLYANYSDCPARTGNEAITTFSRVLNHFEDYSPTNQRTCELNSTYPFFKFSEELTDFEAWKINLCFLNKLDGNKKVCYPTLLGDDKDNSQHSLSNVVQKIASRTKGYSGESCKTTKESNFKPSLLQYRSGCHIIKKEEACSGISCDFKVMLGQTEFKQFFVDSNLNFELFHHEFTNENKSMVNIYSKGKKKTVKRIQNITSFVSTFKKHKKALFLGLACAEELLPSFFRRKALNQCSPLPFIVDGFFEKDQIYSLITRTGVDQVHAPRIITWSNIFNGIKHFQNLHPIKLWGFYAIY